MVNSPSNIQSIPSNGHPSSPSKTSGYPIQSVQKQFFFNNRPVHPTILKHPVSPSKELARPVRPQPYGRTGRTIDHTGWDSVLVREILLYEDTIAEAVLTWCKDPAVTQEFPQDILEWVNDLTSNSKPNEGLLEPVAVFIAREWLHNDERSGAIDLFYWVNGYISKVCPDEIS